MNLKSLLLGSAAALCFFSVASADIIYDSPPTNMASIEGVVTSPQVAALPLGGLIAPQDRIGWNQLAIKEIITADDPFEAASAMPQGGLIITKDDGGTIVHKRPYNPPLVVTEGWGGVIVKPPVHPGDTDGITSDGGTIFNKVNPGGGGGDKLTTTDPGGTGVIDPGGTGGEKLALIDGDGGMKKPIIPAPNFAEEGGRV